MLKTYFGNLLRRSLVILKNSLSFSIPMNFLLSVLQATPKLPEPIHISKQVSPSLEKYFSRCSKTNCGFSVSFFMVLLFLLVLHLITLIGNLGSYTSATPIRTYCSIIRYNFILNNISR